MTSITKLVGAALLASAAMAGLMGVAYADQSVSGSVTLTSDYLFRGISQSDGNAAIQGSLDYANGTFYAGAWGSSINFGAISPVDVSPLELDLYAGVKPTTGVVSWDLGVIAYLYPNSTDLAGELDYYEAKAAASFTPGGGPLTFGGALYYSPDFTLETGTGWYGELNLGYKVNDAIALSAAYGHQDVETIGDYNTWNIGARYSIDGFLLGLTYSDSDAFDNGFTVDETTSDGRFVFSIGRAL